MSNAEAVERAKADLQELNKKINVLSMEKARTEAQIAAHSRERDRILAFVQLVDKYFAPPPEPQPAETIIAPPGPAPTSEAASDENPKKNKALSSNIVRTKRRSRAKRGKVRRIPQKPPETPTMPDMIREALRVAKAKGKDGLAPKEMRVFIAKRWWPEVPGQAISPIAWRMHHKDHALGKDGGIYTLLEAAE